MSAQGPLISVSDLAGLGRDADVAILDCSWHMPAQNRDPEQEFRDGHIPGAQRFDYDRDVADTGSDLPHMLPGPEAFQAAARARGIGPDTLVVCYDSTGMFAAPRGWWMFRAMGHEHVVVLDGGLPAWRSADQPIEQGDPRTPAAGNFVARPDEGWLRHAAQVKDALDQPGVVVIDARPGPRFRGEEAEPRPGLRSGAMPGAVNLPFGELLADGRMRPADELAAIFDRLGATRDNAVIATCGSGVTAAIVALAAVVAGRDEVAVYDGSWAEWGAETRPDLPVVGQT